MKKKGLTIDEAFREIESLRGIRGKGELISGCSGTVPVRWYGWISAGALPVDILGLDAENRPAKIKSKVKK